MAYDRNKACRERYQRIKAGLHTVHHKKKPGRKKKVVEVKPFVQKPYTITIVPCKEPTLRERIHNLKFGY